MHHSGAALRAAASRAACGRALGVLHSAPPGGAAASPRPRRHASPRRCPTPRDGAVEGAAPRAACVDVRGCSWRAHVPAVPAQALQGGRAVRLPGRLRGHGLPRAHLLPPGAPLSPSPPPPLPPPPPPPPPTHADALSSPLPSPAPLRDPSPSHTPSGILSDDSPRRHADCLPALDACCAQRAQAALTQAMRGTRFITPADLDNAAYALQAQPR